MSHAAHIDDFVPCKLCGNCLTCDPHHTDRCVGEFDPMTAPAPVEKAVINPAPDNLIAAFEAEIKNNKPCDCNFGTCGDWTCHEVKSLIDRIHQDWRERMKDRDQWVLDREEYISNRAALRAELAQVRTENVALKTSVALYQDMIATGDCCQKEESK